jgi:hypothetical protein
VSPARGRDLCGLEVHLPPQAGRCTKEACRTSDTNETRVLHADLLVEDEGT